MKSQNAQIGINRENAKVSIEQPKADVNIKTEHVKVKVESTLVKVEIDQKQAFSESGLKGILELSIDNAKEAMQKNIQESGRIVEEGNQLADIANGSNAIAEIAYSKSANKSKHEFNMVTMPTSGADINVIEGNNDIQVEGGTVDIEVKVNEPVVEYKAGKIEIYIKQKNSLEINAVKDKFDKQV